MCENVLKWRTNMWTRHSSVSTFTHTRMSTNCSYSNVSQSSFGAQMIARLLSWNSLQIRLQFPMTIADAIESIWTSIQYEYLPLCFIRFTDVFTLVHFISTNSRETDAKSNNWKLLFAPKIARRVYRCRNGFWCEFLANKYFEYFDHLDTSIIFCSFCGTFHVTPIKKSLKIHTKNYNFFSAKKSNLYVLKYHRYSLWMLIEHIETICHYSRKIWHEEVTAPSHLDLGIVTSKIALHSLANVIFQPLTPG